jgi:hypothetical protein
MIILTVVLILLMINGINKMLTKLEFKQNVLCYDMYLLNKEIKKEEISLLKNS